MKTALIVDDSSYNRTFLSVVLRKKGMKVEMAENGEEAVKKFIEVKPDIVFLDYIMPKKNGVEALKEMKAINTEFIAIMVTSISSAEEVTAAKLAGAEGYILKPYETEKIASILIKHHLVE